MGGKGRIQMAKEEVTGYLLGLSHLFYLPKQSKVFFLELLTTTGDKTRLILVCGVVVGVG